MADTGTVVELTGAMPSSLTVPLTPTTPITAEQSLGSDDFRALAQMIESVATTVVETKLASALAMMRRDLRDEIIFGLSTEDLREQIKDALDERLHIVVSLKPELA